MKKKPLAPTLLLLWLGWWVILYGFQLMVTSRLEIGRPDFAVPWTPSETRKFSNKGKIYLLEPFMNQLVAWDSEYYLGIAVGGYEDPAAGKAQTADGEFHIKNYAFFPFYPYVMRFLMIPLGSLGMSAIATATLAGSLTALLGTLAGILALYALTKDFFDEDGVIRTAFYMLIFRPLFSLHRFIPKGFSLDWLFGPSL
jgi:hypothetical protein